ncbi:MAG TPA: FIST N-terminal domain-containing protein [Burkholderiales bacterium]|nr:FIST N-terminal domain-containing protein [Burkholderiales bacterium]
MRERGPVAKISLPRFFSLIRVTETITTITSETDSARAGAELGRAIHRAFHGAPADAVVLFASAQHDYPRLLRALSEEAGTTTIAGSSSAGEFTDSQHKEGHVSAMAIRSPDIRCAIGVGRGIGRDPAAAARQVAAGFKGLTGPALPYRSALVMTDALAGHTDAVVEELTLLTGGNYRFFGGGAGDDGRFRQTHVFAGTEAYSDALVALELQSVQPLGVGVAHGWVPAGPGYRVTESAGSLLVSLNGAPAQQAIEEHARQSGQRFDPADPMPFFLHNIIGIQSDGHYRLRVPLGVNPDGSVPCAADIPTGAVVHFMRTSQESAVKAAEQATRAALAALGGRKPAAALVFDCVATRLRLGKAFDDELRACADLLGPAPFVGCNTYGQIARAEGQFGGFHNCTAVVCVIPH